MIFCACLRIVLRDWIIFINRCRNSLILFIQLLITRNVYETTKLFRKTVYHNDLLTPKSSNSSQSLLISVLLPIEPTSALPGQNQSEKLTECKCVTGNVDLPVCTILLKIDQSSKCECKQMRFLIKWSAIFGSLWFHCLFIAFHYGLLPLPTKKK